MNSNTDYDHGYIHFEPLYAALRKPTNVSMKHSCGMVVFGFDAHVL